MIFLIGVACSAGNTYVKGINIKIASIRSNGDNFIEAAGVKNFCTRNICFGNFCTRADICSRNT